METQLSNLLQSSISKLESLISKGNSILSTAKYPDSIESIEKSIKSLNENFLKSREIYDEKIKLDELELLEHKKALEVKNKNDDLIDSYIDSLK